MGVPDRYPVLYASRKMSRLSQLALVLEAYVLDVAIGVASGGTFDLRVALTGAVALVPTAASVHYANEFSNRETDERTERTLFSGGVAHSSERASLEA